MLHAFLHRIFAPLLLVFISNVIQSQCLGYTTPDTFYVCQSAPFEIIVTNTGNTSMQDIQVSIEFTTESGIPCGMEYVAGTLNGGTEVDISNLSKPVFTISDLGVGESQTLCLEAFAPCSVKECIDDAELFKNTITLSSSNCNETVQTLPYQVETALLLITNIANTFLEGSQGGQLKRYVTIQNTRPGSVSSFIFTDVHQGGISVSTTIGDVVFSDPLTWQIELDENDFQALGIGPTFDFMESLTITEDIIVNACGFDTTSTISDLLIEWGCLGQVCQDDMAQAFVGIGPTDLIPELVFEPIVEVPECFCGPDPLVQGMKVSNIGDGAATDLILKIEQLSPNGGLDNNNLRMDSAGFTIQLASEFAGGSVIDIPGCYLPDGISKYSEIRVPRLDPGKMVTVFWDVYICQQNCNQPRETWSYRYDYYKECPPDRFFSLPDTIYVSEGKDGMTVDIDIDKSPLVDGETYEVSYEVNYENLATVEDSLVLEIYFPICLQWDDANTLEMNGETPHLEFFPIGDSTLIRAKYDLPFSSNEDSLKFLFSVDCDDFNLCFSSCTDSLLTSCVGIDSCRGSATLGLRIPIATYIQGCDTTAYTCGLGACRTLAVAQECYDSTCVIPIPGYVDMQFEAERVNFGKGDNNNDHFPDSDFANLNLIRKDRLIVGDTIGTTLKGVVVMDEDTTFRNGFVDILFNGADLGFINSALISPDGITPVYGNLKVYDNSEGVWYECDDIDPIVRSIPLRYSYKIAGDGLLPCGGPSNFIIENGDSIHFEGGYRIDYNLLRVDPVLNTWPLMALLTVRSGIPVFNEDPNLVLRDTLFKCGCPAEVFEVSGIDVNIEPGVFAVLPCDTSNYLGASLLQISLHEPQFFPYEYRNVTKVVDWQLKMPPNIEPLDAVLSYIRFQSGINYTDDHPLIQMVDGNNYTFNLTEIQEPDPPEEGFLALFRYRFLGDCMVSGTYDMGICTNLDFADGMEYVFDTLMLDDPGENALRALIPNLNLVDTLCTDTTSGNQNILDFNIINVQTSISSQESGTAENVWFYPLSPSGQIQDFEVINMLTGDPVPVVNGIFQLDTIAANDTLPVRLIALNKNCDSEELTLQYGWNCTPFTNPINLPCYLQEKTYEVFTFPGVVDMFVDSPAGCSDLCDTIPYHNIQVFNAERGSVFDLMVNATMPTGVGVIPGTSEIEYPSGSGNFSPINDPVVLGSNRIKWNVIDELLGFHKAPFNSVNLRFLGIDSCSFVSGSYPIFTSSGLQNCDQSTNRVSESADPLCTNGIIPPYTASLDVEQNPEIECNDLATFTVSIETTNETQTGDCVIIEFPPGISYVANSCVEITPGFPCDCEIENNRMTCQLPVGTQAGNLIAFQFMAEGFQSLSCLPEFMSFQTATQTVGNCVAIGDTCSIKVGTGFLVHELEIDRPEFDLSNFQFNAFQTGGDDLVQFTIDVMNTGSSIAFPPTIVDFYLDTDGDGVGDVLVHSGNILQNIGVGGTLTLEGEFEIPTGNLCHIFAQIDASQHCACDGDVIPAQDPYIYTTQQQFFACADEVIEVGITPEAGNTYQWVGDNLDLLECENCPITNFSKSNQGTTSDTLIYTLLCSDNGGCVIQNEITIIVKPEPGILFFESPVCPGEAANIFATDGVNYIWEGAGVVQGQQSQTVFPTQTSEYSVTILDAEGCQGTDTVTIEINDLPIADAGTDTVFCSGASPQLNALYNPNYSYQWSPPQFFDDPNIHNPTVLFFINLTFNLTVTNEHGCQSFDEVNVNFGNTPTISATASSDTICVGDVITLQAFGAADYTWSPSGDCQNAGCSIVEVSPQSTTTFTVTGSNLGCSDSTIVTIVVQSDSIAFEMPQEICANDSTFIFGAWVNESGTYCDTTFLSSGCLDVQCLELTVLPIFETFIDTTICLGDSILIGNTIYTQTGIFQEELIAQNDCDSIVQISIFVEDIPQVEIITIDEVPFGNPVDLSVEAIYESYQWFANGEELLECLNLPNCTHDFPGDTTVYTVIVTDFECRATDVSTVNVLNFCNAREVRMPNVFTPDGDGTNDTFTLPEVEDGNQTTLIALEIWNRWGQKIFEGSGPDAFWDGTYDGKDVQSDIYVYIIWVGCSNGDDTLERYVGDVTVLR